MANITKWFKTPEETHNLVERQQVILFKYFYMERKSNKDYRIEWRNEKPIKYNYEKHVTLRLTGESITFIGNINYDTNTISNINCSKNYTSRNSQFLKSHLQKCIRRGLGYKAMITTFLLIEQDPVSLLRRLPIIVLEDVHIVKDLDVLIWFMVMAQYINLPESFKNWVIYFSKFISEYPKKNYYNKNIENIEYKGINNIPIKYRSTLYSLLVRISYGGMKGDMKFLKYIVNDWIKRLNSGEELSVMKPKKILINKTLEPKMYEKSALDFHCYRKILELVNEIHPNFDLDLIKKTIWEKSSRINWREHQSESDENVNLCWKAIKSDLYIIQKQIIRKWVWKS